MKKDIYIVLLETASEFKSETRILEVTPSLEKASATLGRETEKAYAIAERAGYAIDCAGDDAFESYDESNPAAAHYNVRLVKYEMDCPAGDMPVEERLAESLDLLKSIPGSGYWPYASPAPCSTEVSIRKNLDAAIAKLELAGIFHEQMFGKTRRNCMTPPSSVIKEA